MLQIKKQGNSIVVKGLDHALYPYSGTLEIPCNSVITVVDESDIVTFRSASNYDVLFSGLVTDITINGETVTKENVGDKFGAIANTKYGLTPEQEEKLNNSVQIAEYNAYKEAQSTIDENQNSAIEGLRGNIEGKQDKIDDLNAIREGAEKGATALQNETDPIWTAEKGNYYDKGEIDGMFAQADATYQPKGDYATKGEVATEVGNKQDTLISGTTIKTINGESILGGGNIEVQVGGAVDSVNGKTGAVVLTAEELGAATTRDLEGYYTKVETDNLVGNVRTTAEGASSVASTAQSKADEALAKLDSKAEKSEIPSLDGYATEQWVEGKGYLTEHQDISGKQDVITDLADIRDGAALGKTALQSFTETDPTVPAHVKAITEEDIAKWNQGGGGEPDEYIKSAEKSADGNTLTLTKKDGSEVVFSQNLDGYATEQWVEGKGYLTEHQDISGKLDKTEAASTYQPKGNYATKDEIPSLEGYATEEWVNSKGYLTEHQDISGKLDKTEAASTYQPKGNYLTEETDPVWNAEKGNYYTKTEVNTSLETKADKTEIPNLNGYATEQWVGEQGYLTEHQPLKTINGETIVGNGNIEISSGEETDPVWTAEKVNYYTKAEVDAIIGNINNALATLING